jgi:hypothetical protein
MGHGTLELVERIARLPADGNRSLAFTERDFLDFSGVGFFVELEAQCSLLVFLTGLWVW